MNTYCCLCTVSFYDLALIGEILVVIVAVDKPLVAKISRKEMQLLILKLLMFSL